MTYTELAASRRAWIDDTLIPWCREAPRAELVRAEQDWTNIAGGVDPDKTLWLWAWSRFPQLVHPEMGGIDESRRVTITLHDDRQVVGYPNARDSRSGELTVLCDDGSVRGPVSIDEIANVK